MTMEESSRQVPWQSYYGPNLGYVQDQYEKYVADPGTVDPAYRELFDQWGEPPQSEYSAASMIDYKLQGPRQALRDILIRTHYRKRLQPGKWCGTSVNTDIWLHK